MKYFCLAAALLSPISLANESPLPEKTNIIFLIGDGMGVAYTSAYRFYQDDPATPEVDETIFDKMLSGMSATYPYDHNDVTDSAAAATALSSGVKTKNGVIGIDANHVNVETMLDKAKQKGYTTGVAVTCQINHATPAAFIAHADSRLSYDKIADQYLDLRINGKPKVDLMLGGGQEYFIRKDRNLIKEFKKLGYNYQSDFKKLNDIKKIPAIGLFANEGMPPALDSDNSLRLAEMTNKALALLNPNQNANKPFFLMLEASQIDWCGHANDIACAMAEVHDMAETMKIIKQFIDKHPNTIFVATADHSTGGLSLGAKGEYHWNASVIKNIKATAPAIARKLIASKANWQSDWSLLTKIHLTDDEQKNLDALIVQPEDINSGATLAGVTNQVSMIIDKYSATGWTSKGHTGEDVQVFSYGANSQHFVGFQNNTDIAKKIMSYIEL